MSFLDDLQQIQNREETNRMTPLLNRSEVADQLRVSLKTVDRLRTTGELRSLRIRGGVRFRQADVEAYLATQGKGGPLVTEKRYRLQRPDEVILSGDLANTFEVRVGCGDNRPNPRCFEGRWFCEASACSAREVTASFEFMVEKPPIIPPVMKCPTCGEVLRFLSYLAEVLLLPVEDDNDFLPAS
jgi:excisionase family DNA binding protein